MRINDRRYSIFISSTYKDLINIREKLMKTVLKMNQFPVGMELFNAGDSAQWDIIERTIRMTDYYVLILGHRYGTLGEDGLGYTEMEFNFAQELGIPIISFIRKEDVLTKPSERDDDPKLKKKLEDFRKKAMTSRMVEFWENENEIPEKLSIALMKEIIENPGIGWVRGDQVISPETSNELARLSKENNELREKLSTLNLNTRKPNFDIFLNSKKLLNLKIIEQYEMESLEKLNLEYGEERITSYTKDEKLREKLRIPMEEAIHLYNNNLSVAMTETYNSRLKIKKKFVDSHFKLEITLKNTGTSLAKKIMVVLTFPKELKLVFEKNYADTYNNITNHIRESLPKVPIIESSKIVYSTPGWDYLPFKDVYNRKDDFIHSQDNYLTVGISDLLHNIETTLNTHYYIEFNEKGKFIINAKIVCEELEEPIFYDIPIFIE